MCILNVFSPLVWKKMYNGRKLPSKLTHAWKNDGFACSISAKTPAVVHQLYTLNHMKMHNCVRTTFRLASCSFRALSSKRLAMTASSVFFFLNLFTFSSVSGELLFLWWNMDIREFVLENKERLKATSNMFKVVKYKLQIQSVFKLDIHQDSLRSTSKLKCD